jgi:hypothetical protein
MRVPPCRGDLAQHLELGGTGFGRDRFEDDQAVEHADVLQHFGGAVAGETVLVVQIRHEHGPHLVAQLLQRLP